MCRRAAQKKVTGDTTADEEPGRVADEEDSGATAEQEPGRDVADLTNLTAETTARPTASSLCSLTTCVKASRMEVMVGLLQPATPTPTKSRQEAEKERAQVAGDDSATLAKNSGVILFCFDDCFPCCTFCNSKSASLRRFRAHFNWFLSLTTLVETSRF
jgi:hypothetical protein